MMDGQLGDLTGFISAALIHRSCETGAHCAEVAISRQTSPRLDAVSWSVVVSSLTRQVIVAARTHTQVLHMLAGFHWQGLLLQKGDDQLPIT